jgi:hypothetical protein
MPLTRDPANFTKKAREWWQFILTPVGNDIIARKNEVMPFPPLERADPVFSPT